MRELVMTWPAKSSASLLGERIFARVIKVVIGNSPGQTSRLIARQMPVIEEIVIRVRKLSFTCQVFFEVGRRKYDATANIRLTINASAPRLNPTPAMIGTGGPATRKVTISRVRWRPGRLRRRFSFGKLQPIDDPVE